MNWRGLTATIAVAVSVISIAGSEGYAQGVPDRNTGRSGGAITGQITVGGEVGQQTGQAGENQAEQQSVTTNPGLGGPVIQAAGMGDVQGEQPSTLNHGALAPPSKIFKVAVGRSKVFNVGQSVDEVVVGEPSLIEYKILESGRVFLFGRSVGSTNIHMLSQGRVIYQGDLFVTIDPSEVQAAIRQLIPNEPITVEANRDTLFLSGNVRSAAAAANAMAIAQRFVPGEGNLVNLMKINAKQQVVMRVKVAEVKRSVVKKVEGYYRKLVNLTGDPNAIVPEDSLLRMNYGQSNLEVKGSDIPALGRLVLQAGKGSILEAFMQMVELTGESSDGVVKTLAEPTLTAISGETATLLSGGEMPIPESVDPDTGVVSYGFVDLGVALAFTPTVNSKRRINLQIATEISSVGEEFPVGGGTIRGRNINRASTTVDLPSGGSIMIAGLLQQSSNNAMAGTPGLMNLPIVGQVFRGSNRNHSEHELMVIVTAYIAQPVATQDRLAAPTDGFEEANDIDMFFLSKMHKEYSNKKKLAPWAATLKGPYGYVLE